MIRKEIKSFNPSIFNDFKKGALLTVGDIDKRNTMTVGWGFMGTLWKKNVIVVFVRPTRYTYSLMEECERFTLSFLKDGHDEQIEYMGRHSGRYEDKYEKSGLQPVYDNDSFVSYIKDSKYVLKCKKIYADFIKPECFIDKGLLANYDENLQDYHKVYIAEVTSLLVDEEYEG